MAELCKPKPKQCHCSTMLAKVLEENPKVDRIVGTFRPNHLMIGCRCYLGAAARSDFKYVKIGPAENFEFTRANYVKVCETILQNIKNIGEATIYKT